MHFLFQWSRGVAESTQGPCTKRSEASCYLPKQKGDSAHIACEDRKEEDSQEDDEDVDEEEVEEEEEEEAEDSCSSSAWLGRMGWLRWARYCFSLPLWQPFRPDLLVFAFTAFAAFAVFTFTFPMFTFALAAIAAFSKAR